MFSGLLKEKTSFMYAHTNLAWISMIPQYHHGTTFPETDCGNLWRQVCYETFFVPQGITDNFEKIYIHNESQSPRSHRKVEVRNECTACISA